MFRPPVSPAMQSRSFCAGLDLSSELIPIDRPDGIIDECITKLDMHRTTIARQSLLAEVDQRRLISGIWLGDNDDSHNFTPDRMWLAKHRGILHARSLQ